MRGDRLRPPGRARLAGRSAARAIASTTFTAAFLAVNATSFWFTTRRGKFHSIRHAFERRVATFDVVVSSLAIHNIRSSADRRTAVAEGFRVLRPGGRVAIADIRATSSYANALRGLGASDVRRRRLGWRFWWGNPIACTRLLTARKPPPPQA